MVLVELGSTFNYIDAQECTAKKLPVEIENQLEELHMANDSLFQTEGRVQVKFECGGY